MFGMSLGEILVIAIIAILFIGPDKLPETMVKIAKFFKSFKQTVHETKESIEKEMHLSELKEEALSYRKELDDAVNSYKLDSDINIVNDIKQELIEVDKDLRDIRFDPIEESSSDLVPKKKKKKKKKKKSKKENPSIGEEDV